MWLKIHKNNYLKYAAHNKKKKKAQNVNYMLIQFFFEKGNTAYYSAHGKTSYEWALRSTYHTHLN